jgi:hypothetical protein
VSVANKSALELQAQVEFDKHKKAVRGETSSAKVTVFFNKLRSKSDDVVLAAEGAFALHAVKYHNSYKTTDCTSVLFCSATTY